MDSDHRRDEKPQQYSTSELLSSAKVVAEAAQSGLGKEADQVDKAKVADAAGDLLGAARQYGKLDDKGMGQYVEKAENYLHQYGGGQAEKPTTGSKPPAESHGDGDKPSSKPEGESESGGGGGGLGDYMKMAQGFMKN